jgi:hypothetical protein
MFTLDLLGDACQFDATMLPVQSMIVMLFSPGPGQRKRCSRSCDLNPDIQEPSICNWDAGLHTDSHRGGSLQ